jgi:16S rRNA (guanine527-N7)-methyltransferase
VEPSAATTNNKTPAINASWPELEAQHRKQLQRGCDALQLSVDDSQQQQLLDYLVLLAKWNKAYNLTAIRDESQMVTRHLLDSLVIAPYITGQRLIDVGTGAGLPGVPMAILFRDREFHLLDGNGKKARFLFQVKTALGLDNMVVHQARVESFCGADPYDAVLSRAFASLQDMVHGCRHLLASNGCFLAMKGAYPAEELASVSLEYPQSAVYPLTVPGLNEQRHLVLIANQQAIRQP